MDKELLLALAAQWRKLADDEDGWCSRSSRWFGELSEEVKNEWRYSQAKATGLRQCANELIVLCVQQEPQGVTPCTTQ